MLSISFLFQVKSFKNIEICYPKSPLPIIQKKRFIKYKINIKKI